MKAKLKAKLIDELLYVVLVIMLLSIANAAGLLGSAIHDTIKQLHW